MEDLRLRDVKPQMEGKELTVYGWVYAKRSHGGLIFLTLRDATGLAQATIHKDQVKPAVFNQALRVTVESSVKATGTIHTDPRAPGGAEIRCRNLEITGLSQEDYPLRPDSGKEFLLSKRHLHIRSPRVGAVLRVRSALCLSAREWMEENGFTEVHCPLLITAACEGGATLFPVKYFERNAFLSQSVQLYQEAAITALQKVYSLEPSFRAELSRTRRHITEFWQIEAEVANATLDDIMEVEESLLTHICKKTYERCKNEFELLRRRFKPPKPPFPRITYDEAVSRIKNAGVDVEWGKDFGANEERVLSKQFTKPFFVTRYPRKVKAFYHMPDPQDPKVVLCVDLMAPAGYGEIAGGGQRIHRYEDLLQSLKEFDLKTQDYAWYLDLRKYGTVPHSGFGMGIERILRWILALPHIRDACLFPRTPARVYP
jgi:asparaginyl-tRNA synthetase